MMTDEELRKRAEFIIEDVIKAQQGEDVVSKSYASVGATAPEVAKRRVLSGRVKDQLTMAYNGGVVDTEARIYGAPWEYVATFVDNDVLAEMAKEKWEPLMPTGPDGAGGHVRLIWRRRKLAEVKHDE